MNKFSKLPKVIQWTIAIIMAIFMGLLIGIWMDFYFDNLLGIFLVFVMVPIWQFLATPIFTLLGVYKYLSPMLLVYGASDKKYDLHNGTSFDYLFIMKGVKPGRQWQNRILYFYVEGLLAIIAKIESEELPDTVEIRGSSYFFSDRTIKRLGFEKESAGLFEKINLCINYLDLLWMYSLANGKLRFPNLKDVKTATIVGQNLVKNKHSLSRIKDFLERE